MQLNSLLERFVEQSQRVQDMLYEINDSLSEATFLDCFNHNQRRLRDYGYHNIAYNFLIEHIMYHEWRMEHPLVKQYKNIRQGNNLGIDVLLAEDHINSSKMIRHEPYNWIEGNTIHR